MGTLVAAVIWAIMMFFIMYWAVRLGVENALEARDARRAKEAKASTASVPSDVEPDLES